MEIWWRRGESEFYHRLIARNLLISLIAKKRQTNQIRRSELHNGYTGFDTNTARSSVACALRASH